MTDLPRHDWSSLPTPRADDGPDRRLAPFVVPLAVVGLLWMVGARYLALVVLVAAGLIITVTTFSPTARDRFDRVAAWIGRHVGRVLTYVLLGIVQLVVFTPVSLAARLTRVDPTDPLAGRPVDSRWLARSPRDRPLPHRQYGDESYRRSAAGAVSTPGTPRWIRGVVGGVALLLLGDVALGSLLVRLDRDEPATFDGPVFGFDPASQEALATQPNARRLMDELELVGLGDLDPFMGWRFGDGVTHESDLVTVVDGARRSSETAINGEAADVWFFGGSTMYGSGQSDFATIPSVLVASAEAAGFAIDATNFGHPAYSQWQEVQLLEHHLTRGDRPVPDVVVFYDGFNDLTLQTQFGVHDEPTHLFFDPRPSAEPAQTDSVASTVRTWWADHSAVALAVGRVRDTFDDEPVLQVADIDAAPIETIDPIAAADAAVAIHRRGVDHVSALALAYGFEVRFFWQPYLYTKDPLTLAEQDLVGLPGYDTDVWLPMTERVRATLTAPVIDLSDALDAHPASVYWDFTHTNERGAALIAEAIHPHLIEALRG